MLIVLVGLGVQQEQSIKVYKYSTKNKMGGNKNKHKKKGGGNHNNSASQNYAPKLTEDQLCDLVSEATEIHVLLNQRHEKLKQSKDFVYILSTKWLRDWKDYVGYDELFTDQKQNKKSNTGKKKPGPPNTDLTTQIRSYLQVPEELEQYQYLNTIIKQKLSTGEDFIPVPEQLWQQFNSIYGPGVEIKRPFRLTKSKTVYVDSTLFKCDVVFVNYTQEDFTHKAETNKLNKASVEQLVPVYTVQASAIWQLEDLINYFQKLCLVKYNSDKVTLWQCQNFQGTYTIQQQLAKSAKNKTYELYAIKLQKESELNLDLEDFLKQSYTLVLQIGDSRIKPLQLPDDIFGYCEQCVQKKSLKYHCECNHKHYCSKSCQVDDQVFHFNLCKLAFNEVDDEQYRKKKAKGVSDVSKCGLKNLGNTCYMNSSLQTFLGLGFLVDFITGNEYLGCLSEKEEHAHMFMERVSKLCKQMGEQTDMGSLEPWDIKAQINYFLVPFKGYKQHDAIDFFMGFLNTINDCLAKPEAQAYHPIIKDNILGEFDSLVICPDCDNEVKNQQCFTQLTLPIKTKAKKVMYNYVLFSNPLNLQHGKAEVRQSWQEIREDLGVDQQCLIYGGGDSESGLYQINFDESSQALLKKYKKQVLVYPYQKVGQGEFAISVNMITVKNLSGMNMKANTGYPFPLVVKSGKSISHVFIQLVRILNLNQNDQVMNNLLNAYEDIMRRKDQLKAQQKLAEGNLDNSESKQTETQKSTTVTASSTKKQEKSKDGKKQGKSTKQSQKSQQKTQQESPENALQNQLIALNEQLTSILEELNITLFVEDTKKIRNVCFFCKRKCDTCLLEPDFRRLAEDSLGLKVGEARLYVNITPKLEQTKVKVDLASAGDTSIKDCITLFGQPQKLDEQNAWYCPQCEDMRLALKQLHISKYPRYLIIQLSRFKNGNNGKVKNNEPVTYNEHEIFGGSKYRLLSVIVHQGSIEGGHYWAICRRGEQFYIFNDDKVSKTDKIVNKNAYILCYQQEDQPEKEGASEQVVKKKSQKKAQKKQK